MAREISRAQEVPVVIERFGHVDWGVSGRRRTSAPIRDRGVIQTILTARYTSRQTSG